MALIEHATLSGIKNHPIVKWAVNSENDRNMLNPIQRDEGSVCWQKSNNSFWILLNYSTKEWQSIQDKSFSQSFLISDWNPSGGIFYLDFVHSLNSSNVVVDVRESNMPVNIDTLILDTNTVRIQIPSDPDLRFNGNITIKF